MTEMPNIQPLEVARMAGKASDEIKVLRAQIDRLAPKAEAYDTLRQVLSLLPRPSQGMGEDVAWQLDKYASDIVKADAEMRAERAERLKNRPAADNA